MIPPLKPGCLPDDPTSHSPPEDASRPWIFTPRSIVVASLSALFGISLFFYPALQICLNLFDPALKGPGIPRVVWTLNKSITPLYGKWATQRVTSGKATRLDVEDVSGTEWPLYGSIFYLGLPRFNGHL